ncbi:MAG: ABC transporter permease [Helicobacteraceae bacterium]
MNYRLVFFIVRKYLHFDKTQPFISITAILAFLGVVVGVAVLMNAMGIMNGFDKDFREKLFTMNYPITVRSRVGAGIDLDLLVRLEKAFPDMQFSPYLRSGAIAKKADFMEGVIVYGVLAQKERAINKVFKAASPSADLPPFGALIGQGLKSDFFMANNEKILLIFTQSAPLGFASTPTMKNFTASGEFKSGLSAYDKAIVYVRYEDLARVLRKNSFNGIHIFSPKPMEDLAKVRAFLGGDFRAIGWWEQNGNFFSALELEKKALFLVLMLIIMVASLNIITSLLMTVMNRRREIALFLSLGGTARQVKAIFFIIGTAIGVLGIVFGSLLGALGVWILGNYEIVSLPIDVYGTSKIPMDLSIGDFLSIVLGALFVVLVSSYYPAKKAAQVDVLSVLRNE